MVIYFYFQVLRQSGLKKWKNIWEVEKLKQTSVCEDYVAGLLHKITQIYLYEGNSGVLRSECLVARFLLWGSGRV